MRRGAAPGARAGTGRSEMMASPAQQMARVHRILPGVALATFALTGLLLVLSAPAHGDATLRARIQQAARVTYIHGMTAELAEAEFGAESVPVLLELLSDRDFERRDNVVAVLGFLGGNEAADALEALLRHPPASPQIPDEDRALLLAPQSLGQIAGRGHARALEALLAMTAHGANGGVLSATAARSGRPISMRDDLVEMAFRGLAYAGSDAARARLEGVASGALRPTAAGRDLRPAAARGLRLADELGGGAPAAPPRQGSLDAEQRSAAPPHIAAEAGGAAVGGGTVAGAFDGSHAQVNRSLLSYANHVQVTNPMDDAKLDEVLGNASLEMGRATFAADVACCTSVARTGTAQVFGTPTDGLDVIDDNAELVSVLNDSVARAKVVRLINWCGSTGSNIIGCAWVGGNGMALVRFATTNPQREGALWAHEYGHNTGLNHNTISNSYIMWGSLGSSNVGLTQAECDAYHSPGSGTQAILEDTGACTDVDVDEVHDVLDNCPAVPNNDQADADGDGRGDACEDPGCNNGFLDPGEDCDGANLAGETCVSQGFDGGTLACSGSCTFDTSACTTCGDGVREGAEECDGADLGGQSCSDFACATGSLSCTPACTLQSPFETCGACECNFDGVCGAPEDCILCPDDCIQGGGATCGNGLCEIADGEDCLSCPGDCNGLQSGNPANRFCCGDGAGDNPVSCGDARCTASGFDCTEVPATVSCCGDATCEGIENEANCALDCSVVGCGDAFCDPASEDACSCAADCGAPPAGESGLCDDGIDNDCDTLSDCADGDCVLDPFCAPPACDDGLDNDGDGLTDVADPGCDSAADDSERSPALPCDDGIDNDLDGGTDYDVAGLVGDLGCRDPEWLREDPQCQDGDDNDGDEGIDFDGGASLNGGTPLGPADPTCADKPFKNREKPNVCGLGFELTLLLLPWAALRRWRRAAPARV